jgi:oligopeptide transport system ATP-binding protein
MPVLEVRGLRIRLPGPSGWVTVVDGVDFEVSAGEVLGIAGESGSGKTLSTLALLGLLPPYARVEGRAEFGGMDLLRLKSAALRALRGKEIGIVLQNPMTSLHPMLSVGRQLTEHVRQHLRLRPAAARQHALRLLEQVRIPDPPRALDAYPHQFSGGMRQRIVIAIALACGPRLVIADEPTTALDVTVQAGILRLLHELCRESGLAVIVISHDLGVLSALADRLTVFYAGRVAEAGPTRALVRGPRHPYTAALLSALPRPGVVGALSSIPGAPPAPNRRPPGCAFHPRCAHALARCASSVPALIAIADSRSLACPVDPLRVSS